MNKIVSIERDIEYAAKSYKRSDEGRWAAAYYSARIVGRYEIGTTLSLANRMGVSVDTVENLAHAYDLYAEFRAQPHYRKAIRAIRKLPYVYYSYFRALYKAKNDYGLTLDQTYSILMDVVLAEGDLNQRDLDQHVRDRYGDTRDWTYWTKKAHKEIHKALQQPDLPAEVRIRFIAAYEVSGERS